MLATFIQERDPLRLVDVPGGFQYWVLAAGGLAAFGLVILFISNLLRGNQGSREDPPWRAWIAFVVVGGVMVALLPGVLRIVWNSLGWVDYSAATPTKTVWYQPLQEELKPSYDLLLRFGAACALVAILLPVLASFRRLSARRIWALAKLSFKEAIRRRMLWGFAALMLVFLFGSWFLESKAEDQVRNYVRVVYWSMTPLLLVTGGLLAAFSIPGDLHSQTMHTIVTKPVERFEIILGRVLGYTVLMSLVGMVMTLFSLVYVARGVDQEAAEESLKARVPVYGDRLDVINGKNVGYEWEYRNYISGGVADEEARWTFARLPADLADRADTVRCEFTFDIFRTTKGEENKGVFCTFIFQNWEWQPVKMDEYTRERDQILAEPNPELDARAQKESWSQAKTLAVRLNPLVEKYGYFELPSKEVVDFHTLYVDVPAGLFKHLRQYDITTATRAPLGVTVRCESATQYLGVAKYDLYLLDAERPFWINFFKAGAGLFFRLFLVIGMAVTFSTYLSGVISFLLTMFVYMLGLFPEFLTQVAEGKAIGGGPVENAIRLGTGTHAILPMDPTAGVEVAQAVDKGFAFFIRLLMRLIPDVDRYDFTDRLANGFDIGGMQLLLTGLFLLAYLTPCMVLAYYLMRSREIAS